MFLLQTCALFLPLCYMFATCFITLAPVWFHRYLLHSLFHFFFPLVLPLLSSPDGPSSSVSLFFFFCHNSTTVLSLISVFETFAVSLSMYTISSNKSHFESLFIPTTQLKVDKSTAFVLFLFLFFPAHLVFWGTRNGKALRSLGV